MFRAWTIALALATANLALGQGISPTALAQQNKLGWDEAVAAILLAQAFGVDLSIVLTARAEIRQPVFGMAPAVVIASVSKKDLRDILALRRKGHGWGVIAHQLGVHPGTFNKQRVALTKLSDEELTAAVWQQVLAQTFMASPQQITVLQQKGLSWGDILAVLQIAAAARTTPDAVLVVWRNAGKDWAKVRAHYGVSPDWLPPARPAGENMPAPPEHKGGKHGKKK